MDPYDLIDPVNILPLLPKDFYDKVVSLQTEFDMTVFTQNR